jgi:exosome complex RNA-binding protein Rrp42 (RNase PH superfamily)
MIQINSKLNYISIGILAIGCIATTYIIGKNHGSYRVEKITQTSTLELEKAQETIEQLSKTATKVTDLGLYFPTSEESSTCTKEYPIKVKLDKGIVKYYLTNHKQYKTIKAELCLSSEAVLKRIPNIKL